MALINCGECGNQVSDKANSCPKCGAPVIQNNTQDIIQEVKQKNQVTKKKTGCLTYIGYILIAFICLSILNGILSEESGDSSVASNENAARIQLDEMRAKEKARIDSLTPDQKIKEEKKNKEQLQKLKNDEIALKKMNADNEKKLQAAFSRMVKKSDEVDSSVFYVHKNAPKYINSKSIIKPYIAGDSSGNVQLRIENIYVSEDWLFIEKYTIKADAFVYEIDKGHFSIERDNGSGGIWEWYDDTASAKDIEMLEAVSKSKKTIIRYEGKQYRKDRTVGESEKQLIRDVLDSYNYLKNKSN